MESDDNDDEYDKSKDMVMTMITINTKIGITTRFGFAGTR